MRRADPYGLTMNQERDARRARLDVAAERLLRAPAVQDVLAELVAELHAEGAAAAPDATLDAAAILSRLGPAVREMLTDQLQSLNADGIAWAEIAKALAVDRTSIYSTYTPGGRQRNRESQRRHVDRRTGDR